MKEHFAQYNDLLYQIKELELELKRIESDLYGLRAVNYDVTTKSTTPKDLLVTKISEKDHVLERLKGLYETKRGLYDKHMVEIAKVRDERLKTILRRFYLMKTPLDEIASDLNISLSRCKTLKSEAVREFKFCNDIN